MLIKLITTGNRRTLIEFQKAWKVDYGKQNPKLYTIFRCFLAIIIINSIYFNIIR